MAAVCAASPAAAQDAPKRPLAEAFTVAPGDCLDAEQLVPAVARWLGRGEIDRRISIDVKRQGDAVAYGLHRDGVLVGERKVTNLPPGCPELITALALSIAVAVEATFFGAEEPPPPPATSRPPMPAPEPDDQVSAPAPRAPRRKMRADPRPAGPQAVLTGELGVLWNTLPGVRPLVGAGVEVAWASWLETRAAVLAATAARSPLGSGEVETELYAGRADACGTVPARPIKLGACAGVAWGFVASRGVGFLEGRTPSQPWLGLPLRGEGRIALGRAGASAAWGIVVATELLFTLRRAQLGVVGQVSADRLGEPHTAVLKLPVLGGAAAAGLFFEL